MKLTNFSHMWLVLGLAIGVTVVWTAAAPVATGNESLRGGDWSSYSGVVCCETIDEDDCDSGTDVPDCDSGPLWIIIGDSPNLGQPFGAVVCTGPGLCNNIHDSYCGDDWPE